MNVSAITLVASLTICSSCPQSTLEAVQPPTPVFQLFDPTPGPQGSLSWDPKRPLLSVLLIRSIRFDAATGDYQLALTDSDTKKFAQVTKERVGKLLIVVSDGEVVVVLRIRAPIVDGVMRIYHGAEATPSVDAFAEKLKTREQ